MDDINYLLFYISIFLDYLLFQCHLFLSPFIRPLEKGDPKMFAKMLAKMLTE